MDVKINSQSFRGDIELLRGVAVILVVIFHLKLGIFKSGFIGVDVFFVISGFLMAAAFCNPSSSILSFYERRARRVLPAALMIHFLFFLVSPFIFLPFETERVAQSFLSTILLGPNIGFWLENGYFDEFTFRPMLHYWSLGVEFQYYLVFPLLIYIFKTRNWLYFFCFVLSFLLSLLLTNFSSKTAFFLLPSRIWEFLAGYYAYKICSGSDYSTKKYSPYIAIGALVGLVLLGITTIPQDKFPGIYAILPVSLAFAFIVFGLPNSENFLFKFGWVLRYLGRISYSIYLIHYPVIFLFIYSPFSAWKTLTNVNAGLVAIITLILSVLSYRYIEVPFRNRKLISNKLFIKILFAFFIVSISAIVLYSKTAYFSSGYSDREKKIFYAVNDQDGWFCNYFEKIKAYNKNSCNLNHVLSDRNFLLIGDSHMDAIKHLFVTKANESGVGLRIVRDSCILGVGSCASGKILSEVKLNHITDVVLLGYKPDRFDLEQLSILATSARNEKYNIHFIMPVPTYSKSVPQLLYEVEHKMTDLNSYVYSPESFRSKASVKYQKFMEANEIKENVFFYDPSKYLCDTLCKIEGDDGVFYHDSHHLSLVGSRRLVPMVEEIFSK